MKIKRSQGPPRNLSPCWADYDPFKSSDLTPMWGRARIAKFKLDWIFVKANLDKPRDVDAPYVFAPHFGRTLVDVNNCLPEPISDHSPMTVDLPFHEPAAKTK